MRTTLELDDELVSALLARLPGRSKTDAIEEAIRVYLRDSAIEKLRERAGSYDVQNLSAELRRRDRHT